MIIVFVVHRQLHRNAANTAVEKRLIVSIMMLMILYTKRVTKIAIKTKKQ